MRQGGGGEVVICSGYPGIPRLGVQGWDSGGIAPQSLTLGETVGRRSGAPE